MCAGGMKQVKVWGFCFGLSHLSTILRITGVNFFLFKRELGYNLLGNLREEREKLTQLFKHSPPLLLQLLLLGIPLAMVIHLVS